MAKDCKICGKKVHGYGYCNTHYVRFKKHNSPFVVKLKRHGKMETPEYTCWRGIKQRCYDKNTKSHKSYGGRGIKMYEPWRNDFMTFYNYLLNNIGLKPKGKFSIDRIDNDGNYEPGNLRWATDSQQGLNQGLKSNNTSGCKGVTFHKNRKVWASRITINKERISLGSYKNKEDAIIARLKGELKYLGEVKQIEFIHLF